MGLILFSGNIMGQSQRDIVVIGASAGGVETLQALVADLPASLPVAVFVVLHLSPHAPSYLAPILEKVARLPVESATDGMTIKPGRIYVAVPDRHLLIEQNRVRVTRGPRENRSRPAVDVLFRSAAYNFGTRVIGIVLTGNLDDGTAGLWAVKDRGGVAMVQSPDEALFPSMPESALQHVAVDHVLPVRSMPAVIANLIRQPVAHAQHSANTRLMAIETSIALDEQPLPDASASLGPLSLYSCPDCHGNLFQVQESPAPRYRCHIGHAFSHQTLLMLINEEIDTNLGQILRAVEERILLLRELTQKLKTEDPKRNQYLQLIAQSEQWAQTVRGMIQEQGVFGQALLSAG
jgi:two-component system, chemotaxis family, protein-glutamate methylesterase/glutaminase